MPDPYLAVYIDYRTEQGQEMLAEIWEMLVSERLVAQLFYDGTVDSLASFKREIGRPGSLPFAVYGMGKLAMFSWLNHINGKSARSHFVVFRAFWGREKRVRLGKYLYDYILNLEDENGFVFDCLYGVTPATYRLAIKAVLASGWVECGVIPDACYLVDGNKYVPGVITCATREILGATWQ